MNKPNPDQQETKTGESKINTDPVNTGLTNTGSMVTRSPRLNPFQDSGTTDTRPPQDSPGASQQSSKTKNIPAGKPPEAAPGAAVHDTNPLKPESQSQDSNILSEEEMEFFHSRLASIREKLRRNIIGQEDLLRHLLLALVGGGHILIEGVPGLAKTLAVRSLAQSLQLNCKRIQFTPDLLPADLIGTMIFHQSKDEFVPRHGPIFTQVLLADEINRAPAKVQSALLEAMGEQQVTIGETSYELPKPFFVMATQNPIEEEGTYPLPAAQLDRFDLKYVVRYPSPQDELTLLMQYQHRQLGFQTAAGKENRSTNNPDFLLCPDALFRMREIAAKIHLGEPLVRYVINIVNATRETNSRLEFSRYLDFGASPRASLALCRYAALSALFSGRNYVLPNDIKLVCPSVLRHRLLLSYEAEAANQTADDVIQQILQTVVVP